MKEALLFERNPIPMLIYDLDSLEILKVNDAAVETYGYSEKEFCQLTIEDIRPEEDLEELQDILDNLDDGLNSTRVVRHKTKEDELLFAQINSNTLPYNGHQCRLVAVIDVSEEINARRNVEQAYRELDHLVRENPLAMIQWDEDLYVQEWSHRAEQLSGYSREEVVGRNLSELELFTPEVKKIIMAGVDKVKKGTPVEQLETEFIDKDGRSVDIRIHTSVLRDQAGLPQTLLTFVEDISKAKRIERRLSRQNEIVHFVNELLQSIGNLDDFDEALDIAVKKICQFMGWQVGHVYHKNDSGKFESTDIWHFQDREKHGIIEKLSQKVTFTPGKGFVGQVIKDGAPQWMNDINTKKGFMRRPQKGELPLKSCLALPVTVDGSISVVLEFFSDKASQPPPGFWEMLNTVEGQLGQILERIHALQELEISELRYRRLFERANDGILIMKDGQFIDCNRRVEELLECSRTEIIGESPFKFSPEYQPGGQKSIHKGREYLRQTLNGTPQVFQWKHKTCNGNLIDAEVSLNKITLRGETFIQAIVRDITHQKEAERALKQNEELFRNLFLRAPVAMVMVDQDNKVQMVNQTFKKLFGYSEDELKDKDIDHFIVPEGEYETVPKMPGKNLPDQDHIREYTRLTKQGERIDVLIGTIPVYLEGEPLAGFGIYIDITEQKNAQRKMESSLQEKDVLLKEIHHRVKNNLAVISALLELQAFSHENEQLSDILSDSLLRIKTMALVHETLYKTENFANLKLNRYIEKLVELNIDLSGTHHRDINIDYQIEDIDLNINQAIPCALILNELVSNVFRFAFEGREDGDVNIRLFQDNSSVHLVVEDNGIGLPTDFEEMRKESLGMTLIDQLTDQIHGDLLVNSEEGTTFELVFRKENRSGSGSHFLK